MRNPLYLPPASFLLLALTLAISSSVFAAGGPPMITDDPGTPGDGHWEINIATLSTHAADASTYQVPLVDINYGIGDRLQLKFELPWIAQKQTNGTRLNGAGNGLAGIKWRFYDGGEDNWQISTYPQVEFMASPSTSASAEMDDSGTSYLLPFELLHRFGDNDITLDLGRWFRPQQQADSWIAGVAFTHELRKGIELLAELHDQKIVRQPQDTLTLNFGARWDLSESYTLMFSAGRDLHSSINEKSTLLTYLGLQMHY